MMASEDFLRQSGERVVISYKPRGSIRDAFSCRVPELLLDGPAGTGKTRGALEKLHLALTKYPNARGLMVRKTRMSMTETCMWTYENKVLHELDQIRWAAQEQRWEYPNGSVLVVCGMDKSSKVLSSEYDLAYVNEATELSVDNWEHIGTRLRNGVMPYQQLLGDCNPGPPNHWLKKRIQLGYLKALQSHHEDNPVLYDDVKKQWTDKGEAYISRLDSLTGVRKLRLRYGIWAAAEGMIYDEWDPSVHMLDYRPIPAEWPRYWVIDFGYTNPFVWQAWAEDPDGVLIRYREIYMTRRLVEEHAALIKALCDGEPAPRAIICDHDAEDRATFEKHVKMMTIPAFKAISVGIQGVKSRLKVLRNGKPRIFLMRDSLVEVDSTLREASRPTCTEEEFESYVWDEKAQNRGEGDVPIDEFNHGMDTTRYMVSFADDLALDPHDEEHLLTLDDEMDRVRISPY